uniref:KRAB domain-containing protein n=1 Tax=Chrysemys picta bellii TaxID=8478 RepID=A0A8C3HJ06_CHRPI
MVQTFKPPSALPDMSVTFEDVAMYFSPAEWALLGEEQRQLYKHVMWENYQTLVSLGEELRL